jgi:hypothetical protein
MWFSISICIFVSGDCLVTYVTHYMFPGTDKLILRLFPNKLVRIRRKMYDIKLLSRLACCSQCIAVSGDSTLGWTTFPGRSKRLNSVLTVSVAFPVSFLMGAGFLLGVMWLGLVTLPPHSCLYDLHKDFT